MYINLFLVKRFGMILVIRTFQFRKSLPIQFYERMVLLVIRSVLNLLTV